MISVPRMWQHVHGLPPLLPLLKEAMGLTNRQSTLLGDSKMGIENK